MERKKSGGCGCEPEELPAFGIGTTSMPGNSRPALAYEVGPFNLPARLVERTMPEQSMPRAGATLSEAFNAVLAESSRRIWPVDGGSATEDASESPRWPIVEAHLSSNDQAPTPPDGAASTEDCAEWAKRMLEWLQRNGVVNDSPIVLRCGDDTYTFYLDPYAEDDLWVHSVETVDHEFQKAVQKGLGTPSPDEWADPGPIPDIDEWWANPEVEEKKLPKQGDGKIVKKDITGQTDCLGLRIRRTDALSAFYLHRMEFTKEYRVPDSDGRPDQAKITDARDKLTQLMERAVKAASGYPTDARSAQAKMDGAMPSQIEVKTALEGTLGLKVLANQALSCRSPCKLRYTVVGWTNLKATTLSPEELAGSIPKHSSPGVTVEIGKAIRSSGHWLVKITVIGNAWVKLSGDVDYDVFCDEP